jgi:hypothetical protein
VKFAPTDHPAKGSTIYIQGALSGAVAGTVISTSADIHVPQSNEIIQQVVLVDYGANTADRDSGAPVLSALADGALCYGVHGGSVVYEGKHHGWYTPFSHAQGW